MSIGTQEDFQLDTPPKELTTTYTFNHDILRTIFSLNADMFAPDQNAFPTTFNCAQVCRGWRELIVHDSFLWSKLIDLDVLLYLNPQGVKEVLKRTRGLPLWVKADEISDLFLRKAATILGRLWEGIEKLVIQRTTKAFVHSLDHESVLTGDLQALWDVFSRPAPLLKHFDVDLRWAPETTKLRPLFGDSAPLLEHLNIAHRVDILLLKTAWFRRLRSLHCGISTTNLHGLLRIIQALPRLHCVAFEDDLDTSQRKQLALNSFSVNPDDLTPEIEGSLSILREFHLKAGVENWVSFLCSIPLPLTCAFYYTNVPDNTLHNSYDFLMKELIVFVQRVLKHSQHRCMALRWDLSQYEILFTSDMDRVLDPKSKWPPVSFTYLPPSNISSSIVHILLPSIKSGSGLLAHLDWESLSSVTVLKICLHRRVPDLVFLRAFQGITVIQADARSLNFLSESMLESTSKRYRSAVLLRRLDTLRVTYDVPESEFNAEHVLAFLTMRQQHGLPIKTLDLSEIGFSYLQTVAPLFDGITGLKVVYRRTNRAFSSASFNSNTGL